MYSMVANQVDSLERLREEHIAWQKQHPKDFAAAPVTENGEMNYLRWKCSIPGMVKTNWQGGIFSLNMEFPSDYPFNPPRCVFDPPLFHPNIFPSGKVSLSILEKDWQPQTTIQQILLGIQLLLSDPNFHDPAQMDAFVVHRISEGDENVRELFHSNVYIAKKCHWFSNQGKHLYEEKVKEQTKRFTPPT